MKRRTLLRTCGVGAAFGLAGCGWTGIDPTDDDEDELENGGQGGATPAEPGGGGRTEQSDEGTTAASDGVPDGQSDAETATGTTAQETTDGSDESPGATTPQVASSSVSPGQTNCGGTGSPPSVTFGDGEVVVDGSISAPTPCHAPVLDGTSYDSGSDTLTIRIGVTAPDPTTVCVQCVGSLAYTATVAFDGGLPGSVVVVHDGIERKTVAEETNGAA